MTPPHYVTCPNCGVKRDVSGRYTSPANQKRDHRWWTEEHLSGDCGTENKPSLVDDLGAELPDRWQNGDCGAYAVALRSKFPHLKFGTLGEYVYDGKYFEESHYFVHDDAFAYDSLGAHPMPYRGTDNDLDAEYDQETWYYDEPHPDDLAAAEAHIIVHGIGPRLRDGEHAPEGLTQA